MLALQGLTRTFIFFDFQLMYLIIHWCAAQAKDIINSGAQQTKDAAHDAGNTLSQKADEAKHNVQQH